MSLSYSKFVILGLIANLGGSAVGCAAKTETQAGTAGSSNTAGTGGAASSQTSAPVCTQGDTRECVGTAACKGGQTCTPAGVWSACDCGSQGSGGASPSASAGGNVSAGGTSAWLRGTGGLATSMGGTNPWSSTSVGGSSFIVGVSTGGSGFVTGTGGVNGIGGTANAGGAGTVACTTDSIDAALARLNMVFLLDKTGSMGNDPNGAWANAVDRWNPVVTTLDSFFNDQNSAGIYASLSFFPADGDVTSACKVTSYSSGSSSLKVPLTLLDATGRQKFLARLCDPSSPQTANCIVPAGGTLTRPALQGTIDYVNSIQTNFPDSKTVIVFITDGEPGFGYVPAGSTTVTALYSCDDLSSSACVAASGTIPSCASAQAEVDAVASVIQKAPAKSIHLFGLGDLSMSTMDEWAMVSANPAVALQGLSGAQVATTFKTALQNIRDASWSCSLKIPAPSSGGSIDYTRMNLKYISGDGMQQDIPRTRDGTSATCSLSNLGWYFDNVSAPTRMVLCPALCSSVNQDPAGKLNVAFGCNTQIF